MSQPSVFTRSPEWWKNAVGGEWTQSGGRWRGRCPVCPGRLELRAGGAGTYVSCYGQECSQGDIARAVDPDGGKPAPADPARHADVEKRRRAEDQKRAVQLEAVRQRFADARPATVIPKYLTDKGYDWMPKGVRVDSDGITLVPMYRPGKVLFGAQELSKPGKPFVFGSQAGGTNTFVAPRSLDRIYIAEGVATAMAVAEAVQNHDMDGSVIAAFNCGNLGQVAKDTRAKLPKAEIIIAADNDRWTKGKPGTKGNPGVTKARAAAKACKGTVAIPEFADLDGKPTDFDDLRQREGLDMVRRWLDPKRADKAVTEAWDTDEAKEAAEREPPLQPEWQPEAHDVLPAVSDNPLDTLMPEMSALAKVVGEDGWTPEHVETLANIRFAARELDVDGPPPPTVDGMSSPEALAALEAHAKAYAPRPDDALFEADGSPRGLLMGDDWRKKVPPVSWAVEKWALAGTVVYLAGRGATGKTPLSIQLALAVASGRSEVIPVAHDDSEAPQLTRDVKPRTAVVIGWESTDEDMMRIRAAIEKCGGPSTADVGDRFKFLPAGQRGIGPIWAPGKDGSGHVATRARPTDNGEKIMDWLRSLDDLGLVVFDPVASCFAADENSRALVREFLDWLAAFAANQPGRPLVLIVGHPAKATAGESADYSGTTDWRNACRAMWLLRRQAATGYKKAEADETKHYMCLTLNKLNAPGRQPISVPLASSRAAGLGWRWKEAPTVRDAVASYAEVLGLTPAQRERAADEHRPPSKTKKAQRYVSDRIVDQLKGSPSLPLAAVQSDYEAWHLDTYDAKSEGLLGKRAFNDAMKEDGRAPRIGQSKGVEYLNNASFADAENNQ